MALALDEEVLVVVSTLYLPSEAVFSCLRMHLIDADIAQDRTLLILICQ